MSGVFLQFCAVIVAAIATIYVTGQGTFLSRKCLEVFHGKKGCVPVPEIKNLTIHYFGGIRGRAEAIRLILEDSGISYEQELFTKDTWPEAKKQGIEAGIYPYGQVPAIITDSGFTLGQSHAIVHYIGRSAGLDCDCTDMEKCEVLAAGVEDVHSKMSKLVYDPEFTADKWKDYQKNILPIWLGHFERLAPNIRSEETSYFTGERITWVDYLIFNMLDSQVEFGKVDVGLPLVDVLDPFPKLSSFYNRFTTRERIASYLQSDRRNPFEGPKVKAKSETKKQ